MGFSRQILLFNLLFLTVAGCTDVVNPFGDVFPTSQAETTETLKFTDVDFSDDYKKFTVDTRIVQSIGAVSLDSPDVEIKAAELDYLGKPAFPASQPVLVDVQRVGAEQIVAMNLKMLVLIDLTLPQEMVDKEREAIRELRTLFTNDNLFVIFISRKYETREMMAPSDYVLENYFKSVGTEEKRLFNSISRGLDLLSDQNGPFSDVSERVLMVLSDGKLFYDDDFAVGDDYFKVKAGLLDQSKRTDARHLMYFIDIYGDMESDPDSHDASLFLSTLCRNTGGNVFDGFDWVRIEEDIFKKFQIDYSDYRFFFVNPDKKMYSGFGKTLQIDCYHKGEKIAGGSAPIVLGSYFQPVLVAPSSTEILFVRGVIFSTAFLFIFLLICQFTIPSIRYRRFKARYTGRYTDANMSISGILVGDTCYYCKAPYRPGDEVVAKCEHTMHMSCWEENGYHCPEFGRNCKHGSHYYNRTDKYDLRNAPYYLKWIVSAIIAGMITWVLYLVAYGFFDQGLLHSIAEDSGKSIEHAQFLLPSFSFLLSFILTVAFSRLTITRRRSRDRFLSIIARSLVAGSCTYVCFLLSAIANILLDLQGNSFVIGWIPWTISGIVIALCSARGTNYRIHLPSVAHVVAICVLTMFLWSFLSFRLSLDYRPYLMYTFEIFAVGIAIGLAQVEPHSERFFLHAGGAVKEMDIALYKWFVSDPNAVVSIGKSVDCSLEMSWDLSAGIGPRKAEIRMKNGILYLHALEDGIIVGRRQMKAGDSIRLYHGKKFRIGNTVFEYQERDI